MSYSRHYRPGLKNSVDVQLQTAFSDGNWQSVIRLADKRAKSLKDPYYEAIKLCAESQLDAPADKYAVLFVVDDLVRSGTVVKDLDTIELYEWACDGIMQDIDFSETFGVLRLRWVKVNPKSPACVSCLEICVHHWDLVNAQQIAAIMDKSITNTKDRRFMFWNMTLTFLLSINPQCPEGKQKLYGLLALRQLSRAAETTAKSNSDTPADRGLSLEEEFYLYYRVLAAHGSKDEFFQQIMDPEVGAMKQFQQGRKYLFLEALDAFESSEKWSEIYDFCRQALSRRDENGLPSFLAADWRVWKAFVTAASKMPDYKIAFRDVHELLQTFVSTEAKVAQMYKKNIALALLETTFRVPEVLLGNGAVSEGPTPRVAQLCLFLDQNFDRLSAFDDLKSYVTELTFEEAKQFVEEMIPKLAHDTDTLKGILFKVLELKFRYLLATCPHTLSEVPSAVDGRTQALPYRCTVCSQPASSPCEECIRRILLSAAATHRKINGDPRHLKSIPTLDKDPRLDLSMLAGLCLLKLSGLQRRAPKPLHAPLHDIDTSKFLQGVLVLDAQLRETPDDAGLRLLLIQLYLLLGCGSYAYQLWTPLGVKRTIQDALSPLFFDRISTISPGLFQGSRPLMEPLRSYYTTTLRDPCPLRVWDAFSSGSYTSILDMAEYDSRLRRSCTRVMAAIEERRAIRAFGGKLGTDIDEDPLVAGLSDTTELVNATDYGSFTNLESKHSPPIHDIVRFGPALSCTRSHLALLTEQLLGVVSYKAPKDYKPAKLQDVAAKDHAYNAEILARIHNSATTILHEEDTPEHLTAAEHSLYTVTTLMAGILSASLSLPWSPSEPPPAVIITLVSAAKTALATLRTAFLSGPPSNSDQSDTFSFLTNMHSLSSLRDAALAIRYSTAFLLAWHDREMARNRSGRSGCHKDVLAEMKALDGTAAKALADVKARIKMLKERLGEGGWLDRLLEWSLGTEEQEESDEVAHAVVDMIGGRAAAEEWAGRVLESWIENVKGWTHVKME